MIRRIIDVSHYEDPIDFKKLVTEMRFDEASAKYAEFGDFYVGRLIEPDAWAEETLAP